MDLEVNGYSIFIEVEEITPPIGSVYTHEAKVVRVIDRVNGHDVSAGWHISNGKSRDDAYAKTAASANSWAKAQRRGP